MNIENMKRFVNALRATKRKQVRTKICNLDGSCCALGVYALDILNMHELDAHGLMYEAVCAELGITPYSVEMWRLVDLNDVIDKETKEYRTFAEIADVLEERYLL